MISNSYVWHAARINYFQMKRSNPEPKQRRIDMTILNTLILTTLISTTANGADLLFTAKWCGPCQVAEKNNPNAIKIDVDLKSNAELIKRHGVVSIPKLIKAETK